MFSLISGVSIKKKTVDNIVYFFISNEKGVEKVLKKGKPDMPYQRHLRFKL